MDVAGSPMIDLSAEVTIPDWVIVGSMEVGATYMLTADSGAAKSLLCQSMAVAIARGQETCWMGAIPLSSPVIYLDGENHPRLVLSRLRAMGAAPGDPIAYFPEPARMLTPGGSCQTTEWLQRGVRTTGARLVIIDTVTSSINIDMNSNREVGALFRDCLRPIAREGCAVLVLHHERKPGQDGRGDSRNAIMGAKSWNTQPDGAFSLLAAPDGVITQTANGITRRSFGVTASCTKERMGGTWDRELMVISRGPEDCPPEWLRVVGT